MMEGGAKTIRRDFARGLRAGLDPEAADWRACDSTGGMGAVTTLRSAWLHRQCRVCGHTFRPGDKVAVATDGGVTHDTPSLRCREGLGQVAADRALTALQTAFFAGMLQTWRLAVEPVILTEGHFLLAPPWRGCVRASCRVCGHTFRPNDRVVICPCAVPPDAPRCRVAVHQDIGTQLHCWEEWRKGPLANKCLAMS